MARNSVAKLDLGRVSPVQIDYFSYMKAERQRIQAANPSWDQRVVFKQAAANWNVYKSALIQDQIHNTAATPSNQNTVADSGQPVPGLIPRYSDFMKVEINRLRAANPTWEHKAVFKQAAANWRMSPDRLEWLQQRSNRGIEA